MLNISDESISDIINSDMTNVYYVATSEDKLYYTNYEKHTVTCCIAIHPFTDDTATVLLFLI
jgi:hypothetical protein